MTPAQKLRTLVAGNRALIAPAVFNPLSAKLAANAGFEVLYLGGGTLGYLNCCLEANLNITQVCQAGIDIRAVTNVPLILDGAAGFGDPMHMYHTICMSEAAGFAAIEIEDQILPKRAHHHMGKEHMVPLELMAAKVREAVKARRDPDFMIIARSNGIRGPGGMADAIARGKAYRDAGADMLYFSVRNAAEAREIARALPPPFMFGQGGHGDKGAGLSLEELGALGYRILANSISAWAFHHAMKQSYECLIKGVPDPLMQGVTHKEEQNAVHVSIDMERMLKVERETVEK